MSRTVHVVSVTYDGGSIARGGGTDIATGEYVDFAGDHRPMNDLAEALNQDIYVEVDVPEWAILAVTSVKEDA